MSAPRKHHIVPQLYQKGFARKQSKSWQAVVIDRQTGRERPPATIKDIFAQRDYNTVIDADGNRDFRAEQLLAEHVEDTATDGLDALRRGDFPLSANDRGHIAIFISAQLSRGRHHRANFSEGMSEVMSSVLKVAAQYTSDEEFERILGHPISPEERQRLLHNERHMTIRLSNAALLQAAFSSIADIADMLLMRTWTLLVFDEPCLFTGEDPVAHINPSGETRGYGAATAERLYMPVSPTNALVLSMPWSGWPENVMQGSDEWARRLNWAMLTQPSNAELLRHPDVTRHPLPTVAELYRKNPHWPWGPDPKSAPPPTLHYTFSSGPSLSPRAPAAYDASPPGAFLLHVEN